MNDDLVQRTPEWLLAVCGSLGASRVRDATARLKNGARGKTSEDLMYEIAAERLTRQAKGWGNAAKWGNEHEAEGRSRYGFLTNLPVREIGMIPHPTIANAHCSPDGLVGDEGGVGDQLARTSATHLRTLVAGEVSLRITCRRSTGTWPAPAGGGGTLSPSTRASPATCRSSSRACTAIMRSSPAWRARPAPFSMRSRRSSRPSTFATPRDPDERGRAHLFRCHECGFKTDDSSEVYYAQRDENDTFGDDVFCPKCGEVMEVKPEIDEGNEPHATE